jgi:hypothetical protein
MSFHDSLVEPLYEELDVRQSLTGALLSSFKGEQQECVSPSHLAVPEAASPSGVAIEKPDTDDITADASNLVTPTMNIAPEMEESDIHIGEKISAGSPGLDSTAKTLF